MIRKYRKDDENSVIRIWLEASYITHDFILQSYWKSEVEEIRKSYVPSSETYVYDHFGEIIGFISIVNNTILAIFVSPRRQRKGIGKKLLDYVKENHDELAVRISQEDTGALKFYESQRFEKKGFAENGRNGRERAEFFMAYRKTMKNEDNR